MATVSLPGPEQTVPVPETVSLPPSAAPSPETIREARPEGNVYWLDWYCLVFWMACAGVLFGLHLLDGLYRLIRLV